MSGASSALTGSSTFGPEEHLRKPGSGLPLNAIVARAAKALWPRKTDAHLAAITGVSDRAAREWLAQRANLSGDALAALLRSDDGLIFLERIMGGAKPAWWRAFKRTAEIAALRRAQEETRRRLEELERTAHE